MNRFLYNCIRCFSHCNNCYRLLLIIRKATINPTSFLFKQQKRAGWPTLFTDFYNKSCLHHTTRTHLLQTLCFTWLVCCQTIKIKIIDSLLAVLLNNLAHPYIPSPFYLHDLFAVNPLLIKMFPLYAPLQLHVQRSFLMRESH